MNNSLKINELNQWVALFGRVVTPIGIIALIFLQTQFASKTEVEALKLQMNKVETAIILLVEQQKQMSVIDGRLYNMEERTRQTEILLAKLGK